MRPSGCRNQDAFFCLPRDFWFGFILATLLCCFYCRERKLWSRELQKTPKWLEIARRLRDFGWQEEGREVIIYAPPSSCGGESALCVWLHMASFPAHKDGWIQCCVGRWTTVELKERKKKIFPFLLQHVVLTSREHILLCIRYSQRLTDCCNGLQSTKATGHPTIRSRYTDTRNLVEGSGKRWKGSSWWEDVPGAGTQMCLYQPWAVQSLPVFTYLCF